MRTFTKILAVAAAVGFWAGTATAGINFLDTTARTVILETPGTKGGCDAVLDALSFLSPPTAFMPSHPASRLQAVTFPGASCLENAADSLSWVGTTADYSNQADDYWGTLSKIATSPNLPTSSSLWEIKVPANVWAAAMKRTVEQAGATFTGLDLTQTAHFDTVSQQVRPGNAPGAHCTAASVPDACCTNVGTGPTCPPYFYQARGLRGTLILYIRAVYNAADAIFFGSADSDNQLTNDDPPKGAIQCASAGNPDVCCQNTSVGLAGAWQDEQCTAVATPFPCCTGAGTGTCFPNFCDGAGQCLAAEFPDDCCLDTGKGMSGLDQKLLCTGVGDPYKCCTGAGDPTNGCLPNFCDLALPDPGAPLSVSCKGALDLDPNTVSVTTGTVVAVVEPGGPAPAGIGTVIVPSGVTPGGHWLNCNGGLNWPCTGHVMEFTSGTENGRQFDISAWDSTTGAFTLGQSGTAIAASDTFVVKDFENSVAGVPQGTYYGPPYPGDNGAGNAPTNANPCPNVADLIPSPGFVDGPGGTSDTTLTAFAAAQIGLGVGSSVVGGASPASGTLDWKILEASGPVPGIPGVPGPGDLDGDTVPNELDGCQLVPENPAGPSGGIPGLCDSDGDGYNNVCDGDFNQSNTTSGADFNPIFLTDFVAGTDSGVGTDMNCSNTVSGADFNPAPPIGGFLPNFVSGFPGPSGYRCAGASGCLACTAPQVPFLCCEGFQTCKTGNDVITQFCTCP